MSKGKIPLEPYKGVRDFYPEDLALQKWLFEKMRIACERVGYEEYAASPLESTDLYLAKSSEEIVNEQTYTFEDRGGRSVTLRPEMTPTVARMVAARKRELSFPLRWYSIQNMFRYERPQKGRFREHWQLNADIFGISSMAADIEIISIAHAILLMLGARESDFEIRINDRSELMSVLDAAGLGEDEKMKFITLLDKKDKMEESVFAEEGATLLGQDRFTVFMEEQAALESSGDTKSHTLLRALKNMKGYPIANARIDRGLVRGFTYYTGMVFEVYDMNPDHKKALFGGGRYDRLIEDLSGESIAAVGFGMGDVRLMDFLESRGLLPELQSPTTVMLCLLAPDLYGGAVELTNVLRPKGVNTAIDYSGKKIGDQIKAASKKKIPYVIVVGPEEMQSGSFKLKKLSDGSEQTGSIEALSEILSSN